MRDEALWSRISDYRFEVDGTATPFADHLASAEGWSASFASAVIEEYRRFIYLTRITDGALPPSWHVDRAWQLHLTHSRDYWEKFCAEVLRHPLHHEPGAGAKDAARRAARYEATRTIYTREFGAAPPARVWRPPWHARVGKVGGLLILLGIVALGFSVILETRLTGMTSFALLVVGCGLWLAFQEPDQRKRSSTGGSFVG